MGGEMRFLAVATLVLMSISQASAQRFTGNTVFMAVQCDIGRFAETASHIGLDPQMKADIDFSWSVETSSKIETSWKISDLARWLVGGPSVRAARQWQKIDRNHIQGPFNIHEENTAACQNDVLKVPLGIGDCLTNNAEVLRGGAEASCDETRVVEGTLSGDGKIVIWKVVEGEAGGEYDIKTTYEIKISAPAGEGKKAAALE